MENKIKTLGISLDGVLRDMHSKFDEVYRKFFIKNDSLVQADENFNYILPQKEDSEDELDKLERLTKEKINLPVDTYDLMNHYHFDSREQFENFFQEYAFEVFAMAGQFPRSFDVANRLQSFGKVNGLFETILLVKGVDKIASATYAFLGKSGCKLENIKFIERDSDKWNFCDVLIDDSPESFENKPEGKISVKISRPYNVYSEVDYSFENINAVYNELFLLKVFRPDKYEEVIAKQKEKKDE
jgi:hypothetical protein